MRGWAPTILTAVVLAAWQTTPTATPILPTPTAEIPVLPEPTVSGDQILGEHLVSATFGWIPTDTGYHVTRDGGQTWQAAAAWPSLSDDPVFTDPLHGWVFGQVAGLYHTVDSGGKWTHVTVPGGPYFDVGSPRFTDPEHVTFMAQGERLNHAYALSTSDGGRTWSRTTIGEPVRNYFPAGGVAMFDGLRGLVGVVGQVGVAPILYRTTDGGRSWHLLALPPTHGLPAGAGEGTPIFGPPPPTLFGATGAGDLPPASRR